MSETVIQDQQESPVLHKKKPQSLPPIELLYQQIYDLTDSKIFGFESQIRINDRKLGTLSPALFVPIAERSNQIVELGKWSFVEMSDMIRRQKEKERTIHCMFMPVSVKYLCKRYFLDNLTRQMEKATMQPAEVCVVLPAQSLIGASAELKDSIAAVRERGIKVALSGVGIQGVSLTALADVPVDYFKLDASFVEQLLTDERAKAVADSVYELAERLQTVLIAEGVDSKEHAAILQEVGCSLMQGAYFGDLEREERMF